jgi:hypothetical protein
LSRTHPLPPIGFLVIFIKKRLPCCGGEPGRSKPI